jgi:fucose permease
MGAILSGGGTWNYGYHTVGLLQIALTAVLLLSLPLWKKPVVPQEVQATPKSLSFRQILAIPGAKELMVAFFCYCALEQMAGQWASSYLVLHKGIHPETAAFFASMFYVGITAGRAVNGFLTMKFSDTQLIRMGCGVIAVGVAAMLLPLGQNVSLAGLVLIGLGCAPIYPCIIHSTPEHFGPEKSQAVIGMQMASAYMGSLLMPPLYGLLADHITPALLPVMLALILGSMWLMHEQLVKKCAQA